MIIVNQPLQRYPSNLCTMFPGFSFSYQLLHRGHGLQFYCRYGDRGGFLVCSFARGCINYSNFYIFHRYFDWFDCDWFSFQLDNVSGGVTEWKGLLRDYWTRFSAYCKRVENVQIQQVLSSKNELSKSTFCAQKLLDSYIIIHVQVEKMLEKRYEDFLFSSLPDPTRTCPRSASLFPFHKIYKLEILINFRIEHLLCKLFSYTATHAYTFTCSIDRNFCKIVQWFIVWKSVWLGFLSTFQLFGRHLSFQS